MSRPQIAVIHATPVAMDPIKQALAVGWPEAEAVNILDDSLSPDRAAMGDLSDEMIDRIVSLARYARQIGSDGVLFTCSAFSPAIEKTARLLDLPVLKPNEAMFEAALGRGGNIAMIATFKPAQASMEAEFREAAARLSPDARLTTRVIEPAVEKLRRLIAPAHRASGKCYLA